MTEEEATIFKALQANPGLFYVTPEGDRLYLLVTGGMLCVMPVPGKNLNEMTEMELNELIQLALMK